MKKVIISVVILAIIVIGGYLVYANMNKSSDTQQNTQNQTPVTENSGNQVEVTLGTTTAHEVTYTDAGFSPATLTIKVGDTVTFKNQSSQGMWVGSAMHPSHTAYSGTTLQQHCPDTANNSFDECKSEANGTSWSFTFNKKGTWGYHNHVKASDFGKIIVE
jgi:plastocyanin